MTIAEASRLMATDAFVTDGGILDRLRRDGYVVLPGVLSPSQVAAMRAAADEIAQREGPTIGGIRQPTWQLAPDPSATWWRRAVHRLHVRAFSALRRLAWHVLGRRPGLRLRLHGWTAPTSASSVFHRGVFAYVREAFYTEACSEAGVVRLCNLVNKHTAFDACLEQPGVMAAVRDVIGPHVKVSSLNYRCAQPGGGGLQPLHIDGVEQPPPARVASCNTLWLLDDLTATNGATRVVPGSHHWGLPPGDADARRAPHAREVVIQAPAGSVIVVHGHVWHGGTANTSSSRRRLIQGYFVDQTLPPQMEQEPFVTPTTRQRLSVESLALLAPALGR